MMLVSNPAGRAAGAVAFAVVGGLTVVATLQFIIGTFDGNFWTTSLAAIFGITATCFTVLGLRELLGGPGLGIAAILLVLLGNPLSGLGGGPEMLPQPWGAIGQFLPPGATGTLMRNVVFFHGYGTAKPIITLTCYLLAGVAMFVLATRRARRAGTVDVDRIEFDHQPRPKLNAPNTGQDFTTTNTEPMGARNQQTPLAHPAQATPTPSATNRHRR